MQIKYIKYLFIFSLLSIFIVSGYSNDKVTFKWAFFKKNKNDIVETIDFSKDVKIGKDDKIKIVISPIKKSFFYIYYLAPDNELTVLFPENPKTELETDKIYNIPKEGTEWFTFDDFTGIDRFYFFASNERLKKLENLTFDYVNLTNKNEKNKDKINKTKKELLDEILRVRSVNSKMKIFAEKPTSIAGVSRGVEKNNKETMLYVEAEKFYGKILRINH